MVSIIHLQDLLAEMEQRTHGVIIYQVETFDSLFGVRVALKNDIALPSIDFAQEVAYYKSNSASLRIGMVSIRDFACITLLSRLTPFPPSSPTLPNSSLTDLQPNSIKSHLRKRKNIHTPPAPRHKSAFHPPHALFTNNIRTPDISLSTTLRQEIEQSRIRRAFVPREKRAFVPEIRPCSTVRGQRCIVGGEVRSQTLSSFEYGGGDAFVAHFGWLWSWWRCGSLRLPKWVCASRLLKMCAFCFAVRCRYPRFTGNRSVKCQILSLWRVGFT